MAAATISPSPVDANISSTPAITIAELEPSQTVDSTEQAQKGSNFTAPKKQRKGPKGGTMKPVTAEAKPKKEQTQQQKQQKQSQPKQKGPKTSKPKPSPYDFYYQQLAAELSSTVAPTKKSGSEKLGVMPYASDIRRSSVITETTTTTTTTTVKKQRTLTIKVQERPRSLSGVNEESSDSDAASDITLTPYPQFRPASRNPFTRLPKSTASQHTVVTLDNVDAVSALESLLERHGGVQHGGILDANYSFFVTRTRTAAISFIVKDKIAVVGGDPLCEPYLFDSVFAEFKEYRKRNGLGIAIFGGGRDLLAYGKARGWSSIRFGTERVLNPMDNPVLQEKAQKQIIRQNKQLLDPAKYGLTLGVYSPSSGADPALQAQLVGVYEAWREAKNASGRPQSYTTIYDPFALPNLMIYIYTKDREGVPNGFAALRKMGSRKGYYIDPCVAAPGAPRRITDLLYFSAMALLNTQGCAYLSIGMEPASELEIAGFGPTIERLARSVHARMFDGLKLGGKSEYYHKFRPDAALDQGMYLMFPKGVPNARQLLATMHFANISIRAVVRKQLSQARADKAADKADKADDGNEDDYAAAAPRRPSTSGEAEGGVARTATSAAAGSEATLAPPARTGLRSRLSLRSFRSVSDLGPKKA